MIPLEALVKNSSVSLPVSGDVSVPWFMAASLQYLPPSYTASPLSPCVLCYLTRTFSLAHPNPVWSHLDPQLHLQRPYFQIRSTFWDSKYTWIWWGTLFNPLCMWTLIKKTQGEIATSHQSKWPSSRNPQTINAGEVVKRREPFYRLGRNVNWYSLCGEQYGGSLKN